MANTGNIATISGNLLTNSGIDLSTKADLVGGLVPSSQLPSYVDDVLEYANLAALPVTGEAGKIYVAIDTNKIYRWSGSVYTEVSPTVGTVWGGIGGTLSNQTDLQTALNAKQASLSGTGFVKISDTTISYDNSTYLTTGTAASTYQTILTNPVTGSGTTNYLPKFTGASTIGNSLVYDNGSSVLIGTTTNDGNVLLNVNGNIRAGQFRAIMDGSDTIYTGGMYQQTVTGTTYAFAQQLGAAGQIKWWTYNPTDSFSNKMNLTNGGNLLIGTATDSGYKLDVNGTGRFSGNLTIGQYGNTLGDQSAWRLFNSANTFIGGIGTRTWADGNAASDLAIYSINQIRLYSGNSISVALNIANSGAATFSSSVTANTGAYGAIGGFVVNYSGASTSSRSWRIINDQAAFGDFAIQQSTTQTGTSYYQLFYINPSGNVGIGTTAPNAKLDVQGNIYGRYGSGDRMVFWYSDDYYFGITNPSTDVRALKITAQAVDGTSTIQFYTGNNTERMRITSGGQLKLNTYLTATSWSGTAAGYLAFDSSGNVITVAGVAATDNTKLPLAGGTMTGLLAFSNVVGNKIDFYHTTTGSGDRYGVQVQSSELRIHSGAGGDAAGGITFGKSTTTTFTEALRVRNDGIIQAVNYLRTAGVTSNAVLFNAGASSVDFGNAFGQGTTNRSVYFRGNTGVSAWWGGVDANGANIPFAAIDATAGEFTFWRNTAGTGGGTWSQIMTMNASGLTMNSGNFIGNLTGNATNITAYTINQSVGTGNAPTFAGLTVNTSGTGTWGPLVVTSTSLWGDGTTQYVTIGAGGAAGIMIYNPHIVWNSGNNASALRMGRSGGVSTGAYYEIGTGASDNFFIAKNALSSGTQLNINSSGNATFSGTVTSPTFIGALTGVASQVTINYNNDSNSTYQLLWGSGNSVYGTSQVYINPNSDVIYARGGYVSPSNPWGTADSAYFPNGITTAGSTNWVYGLTYLGNAPANGQGVQVNANGSSYFRSNVGTNSHGQSARFLEIQSAAGNFIPYSFESEYGNHSWGTVARFRINQSGADRPSIQFSSASNDTRWNVGYCYADDNFRVTQNMGYRNDNSTSDGWGTERFRINTDGNTYAAIGGTLYANGNTVWHAGNAPRAANSNLMYYAGFTLDANTMPSNSTGFTYSVNAPYTGPIAKFSEDGYPLQLNATYGGGGTNIAYRTRNGDAGTWNSWYRLYSDTYRPYADNAGNANSISNAVGTGFTWTGVQSFLTNNGGSAVNNSNSAILQAYSTGNNSAFMSFHKAGYYAINMGLDGDNVFRIGGWSAGANRLQLDMSGNLTVAGNMNATYFYGSGSIRCGDMWGGAGLYLPSGAMVFGTEANSWIFSSQANTRVTITSGGAINASGNITSTGGNLRSNNWVYTEGNAGWYNDTYGQGLRQVKGNLTYGNVVTYGENYNGWSGYNTNNSTITAFMQNSSGTHGFYQENNAGWTLFWNAGYACWGLGTDATDPSYSLHITKYGGSNTGWIIWSDRRIKENIKTIDSALDKVLSLRGVYYNKIDDPNKERQVGYIAQEVLEVVPELVVYSEELDIYNMNYAPMVAMLTEAMKEQQAQIEELKQQVQLLLNK
jgi:hypothetical protein